MPTLGCTQHVAYVQGKCQGPRLCELTGSSRIYYERRLDEISEAEVEITVDGDVANPCCSCLGDVEPWCHVLTIEREGEGVVWSGPIQEVTYTFDKVTIRAKDNLAWLQKRAASGDITYLNNTTIPLTEIGLDIIQAAMAQEDSACVLDCVVFDPGGDGLPDGSLRDFDSAAFAEPTFYDVLAKLAETGLNFTAFRNCILLGGEKTPSAPIGVLQDEMILGGNVQVRKDGDLQANAIYVRYTGDDDPATCGVLPTPCPAYVEAEQECYGLLETTLESSDFIPNVDMAEQTGQVYLSQSRLAPRLLEFPPGTRISPDVPWAFDTMIPGQRIDVALSKLCLPVFQSFKLTKVTVTDTPTNEEIAIDLSTLDELGFLE